jgi:hypothetical protein
MPTFVDSFPQTLVPVVTITAKQIIGLLPDTLPWPVNLWLGGRLAKYSQTCENLIFYVEQEEEPSLEMRQFFSKFVSPLGLQATISNAWRKSTNDMKQIYSEGRLIIDRETMAYTEFPSPTAPPILTADEVKAKLPATVKWTYKIYITGGLVKNGHSFNDADLVIFETVENKQDLQDIRNFFTNLFGWRTDVGQVVMTNREPVYLFLLYQDGKLCPPST